MKYGKLFTEYLKEFPEVQLSATRCSNLTRKELLGMAKNLYSKPAAKVFLTKYPTMNTWVLAKNIFSALQHTYI